jgi:uncharacterized integral membrane protein
MPEPQDGAKRVDPGWRPTFREVVALVILVLVMVFALVNLEDAKIDFVVDQVTIPIFFVIAVPALIGFIAGVLFQARRAKRTRD